MELIDICILVGISLWVGAFGMLLVLAVAIGAYRWWKED